MSKKLFIEILLLSFNKKIFYNNWTYIFHSRWNKALYCIDSLLELLSELAKNPNGSNLWQSTVFMSYEFCGTLIQWKVFISFFLQTRVFFVVNKSIVISYASHIQTYKCLPGCINRLTNERDLCAIDFIECCLSSYFDAASFHRFAMQPKSSLFSFIYFLIILMSSFW